MSRLCRVGRQRHLDQNGSQRSPGHCCQSGLRIDDQGSSVARSSRVQTLSVRTPAGRFSKFAISSLEIWYLGHEAWAAGRPKHASVPHQVCVGIAQNGRFEYKVVGEERMRCILGQLVCFASETGLQKLTES